MDSSTSSSILQNSVLILPALQLPVERASLRAAYRDALNRAIHATSPATNSSLTSRLDVVVLFNGGFSSGRTELFSAFQSLFAELYTLICISAGRLQVDLDFPGGVDLRVVAVDAANSRAEPLAPAISPEVQAATAGPLSCIAALLASRRAYGRYFVLGQEILANTFQNRGFQDFWQTIENGQSLDRVSAETWDGVKVLPNTIAQKILTGNSGKIHTKVAVGGTFDHLHLGHKLLLTATIFIAQPNNEEREITIGITGDELLVNKKHASVLESWDRRQQRTADFVESILVSHPDVSHIRRIERIDEPGPNGKVVKVTYTAQTGGNGKVTINYVQISDPFGPTITDPSISALIISAETRAGGKAVNDKRTEKGWSALEVFEVDVLDAGSVDDAKEQDSAGVKAGFESKISSTEIRRRLAAGQGQS